MPEADNLTPEEAESFVAPTTPSFETAPETPSSSQPKDSETISSDQPALELLSQSEISPVENRPGDQFSRQMEQLRSSVEPIGRGAEKHVYVHPEDLSKVVALYRKDQRSLIPPESFQERYYVRKILHLLYPNNIPDVHLSASKPDAVILDRVQPEEEKGVAKLWRRLTDPISRKLFELRVQRETGALLDPHPVNFMRSVQGALTYVDSPIDSTGLSIERDRLERIIARRLSVDDQTRARSYLARLDYLKREQHLQKNRHQ